MIPVEVSTTANLHSEIRKTAQGMIPTMFATLSRRTCNQKTCCCWLVVCLFVCLLLLLMEVVVVAAATRHWVVPCLNEQSNRNEVETPT